MCGVNENRIEKKSMLDTVLGENIRQKRLEKNISQEELAEKLDISRQSISKWENGLSEPSKKNLAQLARILGCEMAELMPDAHDIIEKDTLIVVGIAVLKEDIDRLKALFQEMPSDMYDGYKVSFVIACDSVQMGELKNRIKIEQCVKRPVIPITFGLDEIEPNQIFVTEQNSAGGGFTPFFRSLAETYGENSAAVLLSGRTGHEEGISLVKKAGGLTICCEPERRLPNRNAWSAAGSSAFNHVLEPAVMGYWIASFVRRRYLGEDDCALAVLDDKYCNQVIKILRKKSELLLEDFKEEYIITALLECMERRPAFPSPDFYMRLLEESEEERKYLLESILRCARRNAPGVGDLLELESVLPQIHMDSSEIRIWVADCGNGLEVYTIAMLLADSENRNAKYENVKIFATDMDEETISAAIKGRYTESELAEIPEQWKNKYFQKEGRDWLIRQRIRNMVIFSVHDIMTNPPFARLDLVVCRNAMNIFRIRSRRNIIKRFSYALKQNGILVLGRGQDIKEIFRWFARLEGYEAVFMKERGVSFLKPVYAEKENYTAGKVIEELLAASRPSCIITDERYEIIYMGKDGGRYLEFRTGEFSKNLFDNIDRKIGMHINAIIRKLRREEGESSESVRIRNNSGSFTVHVLRKLISDANYYLIWFEETQDGEEQLKSADYERAELEHELKITQESLMQALEELESVKSKYEISNEKLQSTNEELVVINDELSVANGELEAMNRKLTRVNKELTEANKRFVTTTQWDTGNISQVSDPVRELYQLLAVEIIYLDREFCIKRFTEGIPKLINVRQQDLGHNILNLVPEEDYAEWTAGMRKAAQGEKVFRRLEDKGGCLMIEILPYMANEIMQGYVVMIQKM